MESNTFLKSGYMTSTCDRTRKEFKKYLQNVTLHEIVKRLR